VPYLTADAHLVEQWRRELGSLDGYKVGVVWQGDLKFAFDANRSVSLAAFAPLAAIPGVRLFSLQVVAGAEQVRHAAFPITDLGSRFDPRCFSDAAATMTSLDLVISVDSAPAHLAGALGAPV